MLEPADRLRARIARQGPVPWSTLIETALYGPGGFYSGGGGAGRSRDFLTSPALGPLFGAVVAEAIDRAWDSCGRPDPWIVVEVGAGDGTLAASVLAAVPDCAPALRYIAVEASPILRAAAVARLPVEDLAQVLGPRGGTASGTQPVASSGPLVTVAAEAPVGPFTGMVFANELLDNLPFDLYLRDGAGWREIRVGEASGGLVEVEVPAAPDVAAHLDRLAPDAPIGGRVPWQGVAQAWVRDSLNSLERGCVVAVDYGRTTGELAAVAPSAWMRTYRKGGPGTSPLADLGAQDITSDVAIDQLTLVHRPARIRSQAEWADVHGMSGMEQAAAATWRERAAIGDLAALRARSRMGEAAALRDLSGLGGFVVIEWGAD